MHSILLKSFFRQPPTDEISGLRVFSLLEEGDW
jgi:hypothetical protein